MSRGIKVAWRQESVHSVGDEDGQGQPTICWLDIILKER